MKLRNGFVSNSSSSSFMITNLSKHEKKLSDFVIENPEILEQFFEDFEYYKHSEDITQERLIEDAKDEEIVFPPNKPLECIFGDEDGTVIGLVFDYALRYFACNNWDIRFKESLR